MTDRGPRFDQASEPTGYEPVLRRDHPFMHDELTAYLLSAPKDHTFIAIVYRLGKLTESLARIEGLLKRRK